MGGDHRPIDPHDTDIERNRQEEPMRYEIRVAASLDESWSQWFAGMRLEPLEDATTRLIGDLPDQAALHGVLAQVRDLGLEIITVARVHDDGEAGSASIRPAAPDRDAT